MEEIKTKVKELKTGWEMVHSIMSDSPESWQPHLRFIQPAQIKEVIDQICFLLDRSKALGGFKPTYRVAKGLAYTALNNALAALENLKGSQWNSFPTFLTSLNNILAAFHTMFLFSDTDESRRIIEGLGGKLAENLGLIDTAQKELASKKELLEETQKVIDTANEKAVSIIKKETETKEVLEKIIKNGDAVSEVLSQVREKEEEIETIKENLTKQITKNNELDSKIEKQLNKIEELNLKSGEQQNLIDALLPNAASAGLAASFAKRVEQTNKIKWVWMGGFITSIIGLIVIALFIIDNLENPGSEIWQVILQKLPFTAPCIWLGWFSAIQYGNTIRIQEDYAFKEATSKAFVGYKDHMEYLSDINIEDTKSAMKLLSERTIEILARDPGRFYQKSENDATPFKSFLFRKNGNGTLIKETVKEEGKK